MQISCQVLEEFFRQNTVSITDALEGDLGRYIQDFPTLPETLGGIQSLGDMGTYEDMYYRNIDKPLDEMEPNASNLIRNLGSLVGTDLLGRKLDQHLFRTSFSEYGPVRMFLALESIDPNNIDRFGEKLDEISKIDFTDFENYDTDFSDDFEQIER